MRARNRWGWGFEDAAFSTTDARAAAPGLVGPLGFGESDPEEPAPFDPSALPAPRVVCPPHLDGICAADPAVFRRPAAAVRATDDSAEYGITLTGLR